MVLLTHILVPTDFGDPAGRALNMAIAVAERFEARVTLLHVHSLPPFAYAAYAEGLSWPTADMANDENPQLEATVAATRARYARVDGIVVSGDPWLAILETAERRKVDLIVMGTHGRRGLSRVFLGSVALRVVRHSTVPVLTVGETSDPSARAAVPAAP